MTIPTVDKTTRATGAYVMTPVQIKTFNELLAIGGDRPMSPPRLALDLEQYIASRVDPALKKWTEKSLWLSKSQLFTALRCEGQLLHNALETTSEKKPLHPSAAVGIVSHRAIQIAHTHPGKSIALYVAASIEAACTDEHFSSFWQTADMGLQSDLQMQMVSRTAAFLDSWPMLSPTWTPRFEEPIQAKIGKLTLSARADLILGRPRADGHQTMFLCDLKSNHLQDYHEDEAMFYALVSTIRHGVAPWRSTVYSLASATYTDPDVTSEKLFIAAEKVALAVEAIVDVLTERKEPSYTPSSHCTFCPLKNSCKAYADFKSTDSLKFSYSPSNALLSFDADTQSKKLEKELEVLASDTVSLEDNIFEL